MGIRPEMVKTYHRSFSLNPVWDIKEEECLHWESLFLSHEQKTSFFSSFFCSSSFLIFEILIKQRKIWN